MALRARLPLCSASRRCGQWLDAHTQKFIRALCVDASLDDAARRIAQVCARVFIIVLRMRCRARRNEAKKTRADRRHGC